MMIAKFFKKNYNILPSEENSLGGRLTLRARDIFMNEPSVPIGLFQKTSKSLVFALFSSLEQIG